MNIVLIALHCCIPKAEEGRKIILISLVDTFLSLSLLSLSPGGDLYFYLQIYFILNIRSPLSMDLRRKRKRRWK
jgi:hypothetical protein